MYVMKNVYKKTKKKIVQNRRVTNSVRRRSGHHHHYRALRAPCARHTPGARCGLPPRAHRVQHRAPRAPPPLAFTKYPFTSRLLCVHESTFFHSPRRRPPPASCIVHPGTVLLHDY